MHAATLKASVLAHARVVGAQSRNVNRGAVRAARTVVRPAAAAEAEAAPEPAADDERPAYQQRQRRGPRPTVGPARTFDINEVEVGKEYDGAVVSIRDFGAFVNIGAMTDGLLHISQISTEFVRNVADALENGQDVRVRVLNIDMERGKFAVTMIPEGYVPPPRGERRERNWDDEWSGPSNGERPQLKQQARAAKAPKRAGSRGTPPVQVGDSIKGRVASAAGFGVFVEIADGFTGLLHENEMIRADGAPMPSIGDEVEVVVASVRGDKVSLTQRSAEEVAQGW